MLGTTPYKGRFRHHHHFRGPALGAWTADDLKNGRGGTESNRTRYSIDTYYDEYSRAIDTNPYTSIA
eukprot:SAG31_NODE_21136_length_557_cov_0.799127_1_plen_67_part_00